MRDFKTNSTKNEKFNVTSIKITTEAAVPKQCIEIYIYITAERDPLDGPLWHSLPAKPLQAAASQLKLRSQSLLISV